MTAFFKPLDVEDFHSQARHMGGEARRHPHITQASSHKYPWPTSAAPKEAEIHLEQRSEVRS